MSDDSNMIPLAKAEMSRSSNSETSTLSSTGCSPVYGPPALQTSFLWSRAHLLDELNRRALEKGLYKEKEAMLDEAHINWQLINRRLPDYDMVRRWTIDHLLWDWDIIIYDSAAATLIRRPEQS
jgi:hypothetical protein